MRLSIALAVLLTTTPVYAQTMGSTSGASSVINMSDPPPPTSTQSRLVTTSTVVAPGFTAAGVETCLGSAAGGISPMGGDDDSDRSRVSAIPERLPRQNGFD